MNIETLNEDLLKCTVEGNQVILPDIKKVPLTDYLQLKKSLMTHGGNYRGNKFSFPNGAQDIVDKILNGDNDKRQRTQYFPTPEVVAIKMIDKVMWHSNMKILEPQAGQGDLVGHVITWAPTFVDWHITTVEIDPNYFDILTSTYPPEDAEITHINGDFLKCSHDDIGWFDLVIGNPPFKNMQDIDHVRRMYEFVRPGGQLVSLMWPGWLTDERTTKAREFRKWFEEVGGNKESLEGASFSNTNIDPLLITISR